jgi:uncharacterized membrane protein YfcA
MYFPVSGVEVNPLVPLLAAFFVSLLSVPAGVSGAFLLLPFQVSVLGFAGPAVSPTNLIYNIVSTPGGIYSYIRERRMVWPLAWTLIAGTLPGVFLGAILRVSVLSEPGYFEVFVGLVLLYLGSRMLYEIAVSLIGRRSTSHEGSPSEATRARARGGPEPRTLPTGAGGPERASFKADVEYEFRGQTFSFGRMKVFLLALVVGVVGGIYGVGGGAIIAPFLVAFLGLPVYTVAGAALLGTLVTSVAGVAFFQIMSTSGFIEQSMIAPDWSLGILLGIGGLAGSYLGARVQRYLPEFWIKAVLALLITGLALGYLLG